MLTHCTLQREEDQNIFERRPYYNIKRTITSNEETSNILLQESTVLLYLVLPPQSVPARSTQSICQCCTTTLLSWDTTHQCKLQVTDTSTIDGTCTTHLLHIYYTSHFPRYFLLDIILWWNGERVMANYARTLRTSMTSFRTRSTNCRFVHRGKCYKPNAINLNQNKPSRKTGTIIIT